jgi:DNA replication protein DnaC
LTNEKRCILAERCTLAGAPQCTDTCAHFIALHSRSGRHTLAELPAEYAITTLENAPPRAQQAEAYKMVDAYVKTFVRQFEAPETRIKSLYLHSVAPGTGKTTTASAILNRWLMTSYIGSIQRGRMPHPKPAFWLDTNEFQTLYNGFNRGGIPDDIKERSSRPYYRMMDEAKSAPFAVLDDIGVRDATDAFRSDLHAIINARIGKPTVYTSNVPLTELADVFDQRLYDRIRDECIVVDFAGASKRGVRK